MQAPRVRFTIRQVMIVVAVVAWVLACLCYLAPAASAGPGYQTLDFIIRLFNLVTVHVVVIYIPALLWTCCDGFAGRSGAMTNDRGSSAPTGSINNRP